MSDKPWTGVFRSGGVGDSLIASSAVAILAQRYRVEVICDAPWRVMWEHDPHVSKLTEHPEGHLPKDQREWQAWHDKKAKEYEVNGGKYYNLSHSVEAFLALQTIQSNFRWPVAFRREFCNRNYLETAHSICEVPHIFDPGPRFYPTAEEREKAIERKAKLQGKAIGIQMAGSRLDKTYPFLPTLVSHLLREVECTVLLFGAPGREMDMVNATFETADLNNGNVNHLISCISRDGEEWRIRESLSMIQQCDLVISPDTGPAWAVAMEAMPKIILLSHASPENITKHWRNTVGLHADQDRVPCHPCHLLHDSPDTCRKAEKANAAACMADIPVETILQLAKAALRPAPVEESEPNDVQPRPREDAVRPRVRAGRPVSKRPSRRVGRG